jgi:hypothetical protein
LGRQEEVKSTACYASVLRVLEVPVVLEVLVLEVPEVLVLKVPQVLVPKVPNAPAGLSGILCVRRVDVVTGRFLSSGRINR